MAVLQIISVNLVIQHAIHAQDLLITTALLVMDLHIFLTINVQMYVQLNIMENLIYANNATVYVKHVQVIWLLPACLVMWVYILI